MADDQIDSTRAQLNTHEAVCAVRYEGILKRMASVEAKMNWAIASMLVGSMTMVCTVVWQVITHGGIK